MCKTVLYKPIPYSNNKVKKEISKCFQHLFIKSLLLNFDGGHVLLHVP